MVKQKRLLEPTIGLEPMTCRLRNRLSFVYVVVKCRWFRVCSGAFVWRSGGGFVQQFVQHSEESILSGQRSRFLWFGCRFCGPVWGAVVIHSPLPLI